MQMERTKHQITRNGAANFAPFFLPDGKAHYICFKCERPEGAQLLIYLLLTKMELGLNK